MYTGATERSAMDGGVMARSFSTQLTLANPKCLLLVKVIRIAISVTSGLMIGGETQVLEGIVKGVNPWDSLLWPQYSLQFPFLESSLCMYEVRRAWSWWNDASINIMNAETVFYQKLLFVQEIFNCA